MCIRDRASALLNTTQQIGGSVGLALLSTIVAQAFARHPGSITLPGSDTFNQASIHSYDVAFYWGAGFMLAALVVTLTTIRMGRHALGDETQNAAVAVV